MTELEKMIAGKLYDPADPQLVGMRQKAHNLSRRYGVLDEGTAESHNVLAELLPNAREDTEMVAPVFFDYGAFTFFGTGCFINANVTVLDVCPVTFGDRVLVGPNCTFATALHPLLAEERASLDRDDCRGLHAYEYASPIMVEDDCWIASNVTVCAGVTIGSGSVIGAGSVVTRDIPPGVLAAGNPCRVIRPLTLEDSVRSKAW